jgi:hypothetical protein
MLSELKKENVIKMFLQQHELKEEKLLEISKSIEWENVLYNKSVMELFFKHIEEIQNNTNK